MKSKELIVTFDVICNDCQGDGYNDLGPICHQPSSNCCGGCYQQERCSECAGTGKIVFKLNQDDLADLVLNVWNDEQAIALQVLTNNKV